MYKSSFYDRSSISRTAATEQNLSKMKSMIIVALALVAVAVAAPAETPKILRAEFEQQPDGSYISRFESDDGISREEEGVLKEALDEENKPHNVVVVRGRYSYPGEDGKPVSITFFADETGYHAEGDSIPKPTRR